MTAATLSVLTTKNPTYSIENCSHPFADVQKQLKNLVKYNREEIETDSLMAQYFDMSCDQCEQRFSSLADAQQHYPDKHDVAVGYVKCCGRPFHILWKIRQHLRFHSHPELFKCTACSTQLFSLNGFKRHALRHGRSGIEVDNALRCVDCGKKCATDFDLMLHMKEHAMENGEKHFLKCSKMP